MRRQPAVSGSSAQDPRGWWLAAGVAAAALLVYGATLAPGLTYEHYGTDGGDLITAARTLGVPHPTGYPTYTLLAWLFSQAPIGTIAYRVNLLSAVCAAGTVALMCRIAQLLLSPDQPGWVLSAATALTLATSSLLWSQAVISEVYALLALFAAVVLWLLIRWRNREGDGALWMAALCLGLGMGNHVTLAFVVPPAILLLWPQRRRWLRARTLLPAAGLFVVGLGIYAYLPLAAARQPPVNWGNPQTWDRFLWVVTGEQYQPFAFGLDPAGIPARLATWAGLLGNQFGWWGLAITLAGAWCHWRRDRWFVLFALTWMLLVGVYAFFYDTGDSHVYLLPLLLPLALWWGEGAGYLLRLVAQLRPAWRQWALVGILTLPLLALALHWQAADLSDDWSVHTYLEQALETAAPGGLVIVRGDRPTFALWYGVYAEGRRPDVAVVSGPLLAYIWYREHVRHLYPDLTLNEPTETNVTIDDLVYDLIVNNISRRVVYATDPNEASKARFDFVEEGRAPLYRAYVKNQ